MYVEGECVCREECVCQRGVCMPRGSVCRGGVCM